MADDNNPDKGGPDADPADRIRVEVAYAEPQRQFLRRVELPCNATVAQALVASGIEAAFGIALADFTPGIWSRPVTADVQLRDGDRIELYRPLKIDPKETRRLRARGKPAGRDRIGPGEDDQPP